MSEETTPSVPTPASDKAQAALELKTASKPTLRSMLEGDTFRKAIAGVLPRHVTPERMVRTAILAMTKTPLLKRCSQSTFFNSMLTLGQLGLEPDGRLAHLIPYRNNKTGTYDCQLIVDYKGLKELVMRTGRVSSITAETVREGDSFKWRNGQVEHEIDFHKPRGAMYAAYVIVRFKDGTEQTEVMSKADIDAIRNRSRASSSGPWVTDYEEMAKKTVFRRCTKWLPMSAEISNALEQDEGWAETFAQEREQSAKTAAASKPRATTLKDALKAQAAAETPDEPEVIDTYSTTTDAEDELPEDLNAVL